MGKEYIEEVTDSDILVTEKGRVKKSHVGNKQFRKIVKETFQDHCSSSSTVMLALHIIEKLRVYPMRLLRFDGEAKKYFICTDPSLAIQIIQKEFSTSEPQQDKRQSLSSLAKKKSAAKTNNERHEDRKSSPNRVVITPEPKRNSRYPSRLRLTPAIVSPPVQHLYEEDRNWHEPCNIATLPPLPPISDPVGKKRTSIPTPFRSGQHASREMGTKWPERDEEFIPEKVYVKEDDCMEFDILYRGGRNAEIELASDSFRKCLQDHFHRYEGEKSDPSAKRRFHMSVLCGLRQLNPEVRFLRYDQREGKYYEWNHREAIEMILLQMEGRSNQRMVVASPSSTSLSSDSSSKSMASTLEEPQSPPPSADTSDSSLATTEATVEEMEVDEAITAHSPRMANMPRGEDTNPSVACIETAIHRRALESRNDGQEKDGNATISASSAREAPAAPKSQEENSGQATPLLGSAQLPIELDDDDDDIQEVVVTGPKDHDLCQDHINTDDESEVDSDEEAYQELMNRAMEMGFQAG